MIKESFPVVTAICHYLFQIENVSISYIFDRKFSDIFGALYVRPSYVHAFEKSFVINVHKLNHILSYEFDI